jgi:transposase
MSTDVETSPLPEDSATLKELVLQQSAMIAAQQRELEQLKHYVERLVRDRFGPRSEKVDPRQLELFQANETVVLPAEDSRTSDVGVEPEAAVVVARKRRGGGRRELPASLPRERVEHDLSDAEKLCPCCGRLRERIGSETSEQLEYVPASLKVLEHIRFKYACRACEEHVAIAPPPPRPIEKGLPGPGLLAQVVVSKAGEHMPCYRQEDVLARHGVEIPRQTLCRWLRETADLLSPLASFMANLVRKSRVIHTDDTTVPVLDPTLPHTRTGRFWIYAGDADHPYFVYDYTPSRKRDGPATFLADYTGYLQADAFSGYDGIYASRSVTQVLCWAHARRKFFDARTTQPSEALSALAFVARLYAVEKEAAAARPEDFPTNRAAREAWHEQRRALRQTKSLPILAEFHRWLEAARRQVLPKSPVGEAIGYVLPRRDGFTRYCEAGFLAIDNNLSERMLRPCAIGRKNWTFVGSDRGGRTAAVLYSMIMSAKANSVEPWTWLRDVLTTLATISTRPENASPTEADLHSLLPDVWLTTHPEATRSWSR